MKRCVVAIDLGTSGSRAMAFSQDGEIVARAYSEFASHFPRPGWVEQDPLRLWQTTLKALRSVLRAVGAENVASLGITNQRETTILWERETGRPVAPAIVWQDRRTEDDCRRLKRHEPLVRRRTGLVVDAYFSATKIRWLSDHVPGLRRRIASGEICFGTPDVWILWNLTGGKSFATEPSNAARTLLFDIRTGRFERELCRLFGVDVALLPEVRASDATFGHTRPALTGREIPIRGILGDQQAALFAHGAWDGGIIKNTYGTGLFLLANTRQRIVRGKGLISTVAWRRGERTDYALEGSILIGGAVLGWLRDGLRVLRSYDEAESMARRLPDNEGVYFVPALQGLGAPYWNASARGLIAGLTRKTGREAIVRAALESLAYQSRDVIEAMQKALGRRFRRLRADGGATANNFLMQFQADILGIPVERPAVTETTALGAAGLSGIASGLWDKHTFQKALRTERTFYPAMTRARREAYYRRWTEIVAKACD